MMESLSVSAGSIVDKLKKDTLLIENWKYFYHSLALRDDESEALRLSYSQSNYNSFTLLKSILLQWVKERGNKATVQGLAEVLTTVKHINTRDELLKEFPILAIITATNVSPAQSIEEANSVAGGPGAAVTNVLCKQYVSYDKSKIIGEGSHKTIVFEGKFRDMTVAVKRMENNHNHYDLAKAKEEIDTLKKLTEHENIVRYYFDEEDNNYLYIALELCQATLSKWVETKGAIIPVTVLPLEIIRQCCKGLQYLHEGGIIHRDIKPDNILLKVNSISNQVLVKLSDMGLCKKLPDGKSSVTQKTAGSGTEGWMATEVVKYVVNLQEGIMSNEKFTISTAADVFSMGCVIYFVLTSGKHPFGVPIVRQSNILQAKVSMDCDLLQRNCPGSFSLVQSMISAESKDRPKIPDVLEHHIFWTSTETLDFLDKVSNCVKDKDPDANQCIQWLQSNTASALGINVYNPDGWKSKLCPVLCNFTKTDKYSKKKESNSVMDLIRQIRNMMHHYKEYNATIQRALGTMPDDFLNYWTKEERFPSLVPSAWLAFQPLKQNVLKVYYPLNYSFPY